MMLHLFSRMCDVVVNELDQTLLQEEVQYRVGVIDLSSGSIWIPVVFHFIHSQLVFNNTYVLIEKLVCSGSF